VGTARGRGAWDGGRSRSRGVRDALASHGRRRALLGFPAAYAAAFSGFYRSDHRARRPHGRLASLLPRQARGARVHRDRLRRLFSVGERASSLLTGGERQFREDHHHGQGTRRLAILATDGVERIDLEERRVDPVALASARVVRIASRPPSPTSTPAAASARSRSSIWRRRVENSRSTAGASCSISAIPLRTDPQRTHGSAHAPRPADAPDTGNPRPWRAGRSGWRQGPSTGHRRLSPCSRPPRGCAVAGPPRGSCDGDRRPSRTPAPPDVAHHHDRDAPDTPHAPDTPPPHRPPTRAPPPAPLADREQHAHRLRRRKRQIKRRHFRTPSDALEALTRPRVATVHERHEAVVVDLAAELQALCPGTGPAAGRLAAAGVVVIAALRDLALVVARLSTVNLPIDNTAAWLLGCAARRNSSRTRVASGCERPHTASSTAKASVGANVWGVSFWRVAKLRLLRVRTPVEAVCTGLRRAKAAWPSAWGYAWASLELGEGAQRPAELAALRRTRSGTFGRKDVRGR
jgi:hypothetical protein